MIAMHQHNQSWADNQRAKPKKESAANTILLVCLLCTYLALGVLSILIRMIVD